MMNREIQGKEELFRMKRPIRFLYHPFRKTKNQQPISSATWTPTPLTAKIIRNTGNGFPNAMKTVITLIRNTARIMTVRI
jgi:hypothetical protein